MSSLDSSSTEEIQKKPKSKLDILLKYILIAILFFFLGMIVQANR